MTLLGARLFLMVALVAGTLRGPSALTVLDVGLFDGDSWTLGKKAIGRPFLVQLVLTNEGDAPISLWDPKNTEGRTCPFVVLTDAAGKETILKPRVIPRAGGAPTVVSLEPTRVLVLDLELLRMVGPESLPPGKYTLSAFYENRLESVPPFPKVWTGKIRGKPRTITIVAPEP